MHFEEKKKLFTTGEVAERCGVSVRTVQYYDEKNLVHPVGRSEGGRRLYDTTSIARLQTICLLKALGLSLKAIRGILEDPSDQAALLCLLEEQERTLTVQLNEQRTMLTNVQKVISSIRVNEHEPEDIDMRMDPVMENRTSQLYKTKRRMIVEGIVVDIVEIGMLIYGITTGQWLPFLCSLVLIVIICIELTRTYYQDSRYMCPRCHTVFQPTWKSFFMSAHTSKLRKLTCTHCGEKSWCTELSVDRT